MCYTGARKLAPHLPKELLLRADRIAAKPANRDRPARIFFRSARSLLLQPQFCQSTAIVFMLALKERGQLPVSDRV